MKKIKISNIAVMLIICFCVISCKPPTPGQNQTPNTAVVTVPLVFQFYKPHINGVDLQRQVNYQSTVGVLTTSDPNLTPVHYQASPFISNSNNNQNNANGYPAQFEKNIELPAAGHFKVTVQLDFTECTKDAANAGFFGSREIHEGDSPVHQIPYSNVLITNSTKTNTTQCN